MRLRVHCQNRVGILRDIVALLADYGVNVARGDVVAEEALIKALTGGVIARQQGAATHRYDDFDHGCCWASVWPAVLAELAIGLEARPEQ